MQLDRLYRSPRNLAATPLACPRPYQQPQHLFRHVSCCECLDASPWVVHTRSNGRKMCFIGYLKGVVCPKLDASLTVVRCQACNPQGLKGCYWLMLDTVKACTAWVRKKPPPVQDSNVHTDILPASFAVRESLCIQKLLADLKFPTSTSALKVDNNNKCSATRLRL